MSKVSMHTANVRRDSARRRFKIMTKPEWCKSRSINQDAKKAQPMYDDYLARKQVEAKALGING